jgi:hypothetical protein
VRTRLAVEEVVAIRRRLTDILPSDDAVRLLAHVDAIESELAVVRFGREAAEQAAEARGRLSVLPTIERVCIQMLCDPFLSTALVQAIRKVVTS